MLARLAALHGYRVVDLAWLSVGELYAVVGRPEPARDAAASGPPTVFTI